MSEPEFKWFYVGTVLLALVIGALVGVSASPVVGVAVPLLFALLTAGGALYVVLGKEEAASSTRDRRQRAAFMGKQLVAFALGVIPGIWLGAFAKIHSETVWGTAPRQESAIIGLNYTDARELAASILLDERLVAAHIPVTERKKMLSTLHQAVVARAQKTPDQNLTAADAAAMDSVSKTLPSGKAPPEKQNIGPVANEDYDNLPSEVKKLLQKDSTT